MYATLQGYIHYRCRIDTECYRMYLNVWECRRINADGQGTRYAYLVLRFKSGFTSLAFKLKKDYMNTLKGEDPSRLKIFTEASSKEDSLKALIKVF